MFKKLLIVFVVVLMGSKGALAQAVTQSQAITQTSKAADTVLTSSNLVLTPKQQAKLQKQIRDSIWLLTHVPQKATRRSAMIPGWGQAYNREYWKIPLVYGVLGIPAATFFYNNSYYKKTRFAYEALFKAQSGDSSDIAAIDPELRGLSIGSMQNYRNAFRRDRDYSILWFILAWGLQVVDATVFGHLRHFDVSNSLSMQIQPQLNPATRTPGLSFQFTVKEKSKKPLAIAR